MAWQGNGMRTAWERHENSMGTACKRQENGMEQHGNGMVSALRWLRKCDNAIVGEKLTRYESSVRGCIVIMEQPIARTPQFRGFSPNVLPQAAKNICSGTRRSLSDLQG
jgi:hypothetical protein